MNEVRKYFGRSTCEQKPDIDPQVQECDATVDAMKYKCRVKKNP